MNIFQFRDSLLAAVGATNADEFFAKVVSVLGKLQTTVDGHTAALGNPATLTEARIREIATTAGSAEAAKALGATGITPPAPPSVPPAAHSKTQWAGDVQSLIKAGKYKEAFEADPAIRAEFDELEVFEHYMRAQRGGHIQ